MDVSILKDSYPNAPVFSVSWEILFETDDKDGKLNNSIEKFRDSLQSDFPDQKPYTEFDLVQRFELNNKQDISKPIKTKIGSGFEIKNKNEVVLIGTQKLVIITKNHSNYAKFSGLMNEILNKFEKLFPIKELNFKRLGLRYINHCPLPENDAQRFKEFFNIDLNSFNQSSIANINISFQELLENNLNFRTQYLSILIQNNPKIVIDLDCFELRQNKPFLKFEEMRMKSANMAKLIKEKFALSITEDFVKTIMEKD